MANNTSQKIEIVRQEAEKEAKSTSRSNTQDQHDRTVDRIATEVKSNESNSKK